MRVKVELEIEVTGNANIDEIRDFLAFELHYSGQCSADNPFFDEDCECDYEVETFEMEEI